MVSIKLNIKFSASNSAYKLCDLKPFYGLIHKEDLARYEFWGFGDIDLIYGDLSSVIDEETLSRYDFISLHSERVSGHLFLMRNIAESNKLCLKIPNWGGIWKTTNFTEWTKPFPIAS